MTGIQLHSGKTPTWNKAGVIPPNMHDVGEEVWSPSGIKAPGTPTGVEDFVRQASEARSEEERKPWEAISWVPDMQCGWQILVQCGGPRCHHLPRTVPPTPLDTMSGPWNPFWEAATGDCRQTRLIPNEVGRIGDLLCGEDGAGSLLGVVGRRAPHDLWQAALFG